MDIDSIAVSLGKLQEKSTQGARMKSLDLRLLGSDITAFLLSFLTGGGLVYLYRGVSNHPHFWTWFTVCISVFMLASLRFLNLGHYGRRKPVWDEVMETTRVMGVLFSVQGAVLFLNKTYFSRLWFLSYVLFMLVLIPLLRIALKYVLLKRGTWQVPTVIVGIGQNALEAASAIKSESLMGFDIQAFLALPTEQIPISGALEFDYRQFQVKPLGGDPIQTLKDMGQPRIIIALEQGGINEHQDLIERLQRVFCHLSIIPDLRGLPLLGLETNHFFRHELLMLRVRNNLARPVPQVLKRIFDFVGSATLLLLLSPVFSFLIWKIRKSGGSAFFGHTRIGQNGEKFKCYKFRSMVPNAEDVLRELLEKNPKAREEWEKDFKLKDDPRITPIGAFLRKTSLDELPQLWNVLKGEMSLVGPRPIVEDELDRYEEDISFYLETRPGMTGLWQVSGRNDTDYANRVYLDVWYVKNWSMWYDIIILFKTIGVVFNRNGAY